MNKSLFVLVGILLILAGTWMRTSPEMDFLTGGIIEGAAVFVFLMAMLKGRSTDKVFDFSTPKKDKTKSKKNPFFLD